MPFTLQDLTNAGLPATSTDGTGPNAATQFSRTLTPAEWLTYLTIADPVMGKAAQGKLDIMALGNWATWTLAQFDAWCDANLMTDAQIDGAALSAALKANLKANNAFTRNGGKMLIALRNVAFWLLKMQGINGG